MPILSGAGVGESSGSDAMAAITSGGGGGVGVGLGASVGEEAVESLMASMTIVLARSGAGIAVDDATTSTGPCSAALFTSDCGSGFERDSEWKNGMKARLASRPGRVAKIPAAPKTNRAAASNNGARPAIDAHIGRA